MRALVTGGGGFLGGALVRTLVEAGDEVVATLRPGRPVPDDAPPGVRWVHLDLRDPGSALGEAIQDVDVVHHVAATTQGSWRAMHDGTVRGTEHLVQAVDEVGWRGRIVHVSSFSVYDGNGLPPGAVLDEDTPPEPHPERRDDYAWTKLLQEEALRALPEGVELVTVRPGTIYGPTHRHQHRVGRALGGRLVLVLGGRNPLPLTYVDNTASLLSLCGRHPAAAGRVYNAVDGAAPRQWRYAAAWARAERRVPVPFPLTVLWGVADAFGRAERRSAGGSVPPMMLRRYVSEPALKPLRFAPSRAVRELGWVPPVTQDEAFRRTFRG